VVVLLDSCVSEVIVSCSADYVLCCYCVSVKEGAKDCACISNVDIKSWKIWRILRREKNRMPTCNATTGICTMCVGCRATVIKRLFRKNTCIISFFMVQVFRKNTCIISFFMINKLMIVLTFCLFFLPSMIFFKMVPHFRSWLFL